MLKRRTQEVRRLMAEALLMAQTNWKGNPAEIQSMEEQMMNAISIQFSRLVR